MDRASAIVCRVVIAGTTSIVWVSQSAIGYGDRVMAVLMQRFLNLKFKSLMHTKKRIKEYVLNVKNRESGKMLILTK
jgi:hypothetical protein